MRAHDRPYAGRQCAHNGLPCQGREYVSGIAPQYIENTGNDSTDIDNTAYGYLLFLRFATLQLLLDISLSQWVHYLKTDLTNP
jgi:hypothetical protein